MSQLALDGIPATTTTGDELERFYTPEPLAAACVARLFGDFRTRLHRCSCAGAVEPRRWVEPSVGDGAFVRAVSDMFGRACHIGVDLDPAARGLQICDVAVVGDWPEVAPEFDAIDWVIGNLPFSVAIPHVQAALDVAENVAVILPLALLGGARWNREVPPPSEVHPIAGRPWPDSVRETALWVWRGGDDSGRLGPLIDWK